jgi:O-antigen/teichoic acid export membrane protein
MGTDLGGYGSLARGVTVVFFGNLLGIALAFLTRVVPAAILGPDAYGLFVLGVTVLNVLAIVGHLGLYEGLARTLPRTHAPAGEFGGAIGAAVAAAVGLGVVVVVLAEPIAAVLVGDPFVPVLVVVAQGIPLMVPYHVECVG